MRYDISYDPARGRWYLDASWNAPPVPARPLDGLRQYPVVAVDVNCGHLAAAAIAPDGNILGAPATIRPRPGRAARLRTRDGHLRAAISSLIAIARACGARAIVIEDLDFAEARRRGARAARQSALPRPAGRAFRRAVVSIPTGKLRDRLVQMAGNAGLPVSSSIPPTPPGGAPSTGSPRCGSITRKRPVTMRQRW